MNDNDNQLPPLPVPQPPPETWSLSRELLDLGSRVKYILRQAVEGIAVLGATGSGKTSGSLRTFAQAVLRTGAGALFLCTKRSDCEMYSKWVRECGRENQLCVFEPGRKFKFNFLAYMSQHPHAGVRDTKYIVQFLTRILDNYVGSQGGGQEDELFWSTARTQLITHLLIVFAACGLVFSLRKLRKFLRHAPKSAADVNSGRWLDSEEFGLLLKLALHRSKGTIWEEAVQAAKEFWLLEYPNQPERTRACIELSFSAMIDLLSDPIAQMLFGSETNLCPEHLLEGAVIIVNVPPKEYPGLGVIAQQIWKQAAQDAIERRDDPDDDTRRPVMIVMDEAQGFFHPSDTRVQATGRSNRMITIAATQNLPAIYSRIPGPNNKDLIDGWLGNFNTHCYHAQGEVGTCQYMATQLGRARKFRISGSDEGRWVWLRALLGLWEPTTVGVASEEDFIVSPSKFRSLKTGGPENEGIVEAYLLMNLPSGHETGRYFLPVRFDQGIGPRKTEPEVTEEPTGWWQQLVAFYKTSIQHLQRLL